MPIFYTCLSSTYCVPILTILTSQEVQQKEPEPTTAMPTEASIPPVAEPPTPQTSEIPEVHTLIPMY